MSDSTYNFVECAKVILPDEPIPTEKLHTQAALELAVAEARLEEHDAVCMECSGTSWCYRRMDLHRKLAEVARLKAEGGNQP